MSCDEGLFDTHDWARRRSFFHADSTLVKAIVEGRANAKIKHFIELAELPETGDKDQLDSEHVSGRHCAVLGAGGGKSWTVAKLIEEVSRNQRQY